MGALAITSTTLNVTTSSATPLGVTLGHRLPAGRPHLRARYQRRHADPRPTSSTAEQPAPSPSRVGHRGPRRHGLQPGQRDHLRRSRGSTLDVNNASALGTKAITDRGHGHGQRHLRSDANYGGSIQPGADGDQAPPPAPSTPPPTSCCPPARQPRAAPGYDRRFNWLSAGRTACSTSPAR